MFFLIVIRVRFIFGFETKVFLSITDCKFVGVCLFQNRIS